MAQHDLIDALITNPDDVATHLVYSDWLQSQGDPHGELIALGHALAERGDEATRAAYQAYYDAHVGQILSGLGDPGDWPNALTLEWRRGFIRKAHLAVNWEFEGDPGPVLRGLLAAPAAMLLEDLTIGLWETEGENNYEETVEILAEAPRPALRRLFIGDFVPGTDIEMTWCSIGDVSALWPLLPRIDELILQSGSMTLGEVVAPSLRAFEVRTSGLTSENLGSIVGARWPALRRLTLWFGAADYGAIKDIDALTPLLHGKGLAQLEHLGLMNAEFTDALCEILPRAPIMRQLRSLSLAMGTMGDAGVRALIRERAALSHLERLDLSNNYLTDADIAAVAGLAAEVDTSEQRAPEEGDEDERYVAVSE